MTEDTISQIATPRGAGGIGIIRVSGADALAVARRVFRPAAGGVLGEIAPYTARYGYVTAEDGTILDECVLLCMRAPHSYTGEDTVELQCHGGPVVLRAALLRTWEAGARPAEAGEFTKRAFLNGRLDLARAEGVMELIAAKSARSARAAREIKQRRNARKIDLVYKLARVGAFHHALVKALRLFVPVRGNFFAKRASCLLCLIKRVKVDLVVV